VHRIQHPARDRDLHLLAQLDDDAVRLRVESPDDRYEFVVKRMMTVVNDG